MTTIHDHHPDEDEEAPPAKPAWKRWRWLLPAAAALVAVAVTGALVLVTAGPETVTVHGSLTLSDPDAGYETSPDCTGTGGYDDIRQGAQVTVTGPDGTVLAVGNLDPGATTGTGNACRFTFQLDVPAGHGLYGIEIANRGTVVFEENRLGSVIDGPALSLG